MGNISKINLDICRKVFSTYTQSLFDVIFPPACYACHIKLEKQSDSLCPECESRLKRQSKYLMGEFPIEEICYYQVVSLYHYDFMMRALISDFKFKGIKQIGLYFAERAIDILSSEFPEILQVDAMLSIPMFSTKLRERQFNQAEFLCSHISQRTGIPNMSSAIRQIMPTPKQAKQLRLSRMSKPEDIYVIAKNADFTGKQILLVDDVFTTGATVNGMSKFLRNNGAERVYVLTIAAGKD
jgi:ComF family protein